MIFPFLLWCISFSGFWRSWRVPQSISSEWCNIPSSTFSVDVAK